MRARVEKYFSLHGWKIIQSQYTLYDFVAQKKQHEVCVKCLTSGFSYTDIQIKDLFETKARTLKSRPFLCVAADQPPAGFVEGASACDVRVIYYKELKDVAMADPESLSHPIRKISRILPSID